MGSDMLFRFLAITLLLFVFSTMIAAIVSPPDPFTLVIYAVPLLLISTIISYILTYKNGIAHLKNNS